LFLKIPIPALVRGPFYCAAGERFAGAGDAGQKKIEKKFGNDRSVIYLCVANRKK